MFEAAELGRKVSREEFDAMAPQLRIELLALQQKLRTADFPVILVFAGVDGAGKNETVNLLNEWMDPRWIVTHAFGLPSEEEAERPEYWRYWRSLPASGQMGLFLSSWYHAPLLRRAQGEISQIEMDEILTRVVRFERTLADEGALILKFWMHLSEKAQKKRLKKLEENPLTRWRVNATDWKHWKLYDSFASAGERLIMQTSKSHAPWCIVEGADARYRSTVVLNTVRQAITEHLNLREIQRRVVAEVALPAFSLEADTPEVLRQQPSILDALPMAVESEGVDYGRQLQEQRGRLSLLHRRAQGLGISTVLVFEGWDAAGKGGCIRRLTSALNAKDCGVIQTAAPTDEERKHHYLWRFWRHLPRAGRVLVFDRSWYGRVLVERVENFATEEAWQRAYGEINDFEEQIVENNTVLCKFWLHITPEEQLARFERRKTIEYKSWKLTDEDWRNREKWDAYEAAVNDMVEKTSTKIAPWTLIPGNEKAHARVQVVATVCRALEAAIQRKEGQRKEGQRKEGRTGE